MITVYAIRSELNNDIYVGIAKDAVKRLSEQMVGRIGIQKG